MSSSWSKHYLYGILLTVVSAVVTAAGYALLRRSEHLSEDRYRMSEARVRQKSDNRRKGLALITFGWIGQGIALIITPQIVVVGITSLCVLLNFFFAVSVNRWCGLGEQLAASRDGSCMGFSPHHIFVFLVFVGILLITSSTIMAAAVYPPREDATEGRSLWSGGPRFGIDACNWLLLAFTVASCSAGAQAAITRSDPRLLLARESARYDELADREQITKSPPSPLWMYRSEIMAFVAGSWSGLMYASTKVIAIVSSDSAVHGGTLHMLHLLQMMAGQRRGYAFFWTAVGMDCSCFFMVLQSLHAAMSGEQGNAVVLPLMNASQALFAVTCGAMVFSEVAPWLRVESALIMVPGVLCIVSGIVLAFYTDATRTYVELPLESDYVTNVFDRGAGAAAEGAESDDDSEPVDDFRRVIESERAREKEILVARTAVVVESELRVVDDSVVVSEERPLTPDDTDALVASHPCEAAIAEDSE